MAVGADGDHVYPNSHTGRHVPPYFWFGPSHAMKLKCSLGPATLGAPQSAALQAPPYCQSPVAEHTAVGCEGDQLYPTSHVGRQVPSYFRLPPTQAANDQWGRTGAPQSAASHAPPNPHWPSSLQTAVGLGLEGRYPGAHAGLHMPPNF